MTKKALLFAAVLAGCLGAACAQMASQSSGYGSGEKSAGSRTQQATSAAVCTASPCREKIIVEASGGQCSIRIEPDILVVKGVHDALIEWELDAPEHFRIVSLTFKDEVEAYVREYRKRIATPSGKQFHDKHVNGRKADIVDENSVDGSWYYGVVVTDGHVTCKLDPPVINGE